MLLDNAHSRKDSLPAIFIWCLGDPLLMKNSKRSKKPILLLLAITAFMISVGGRSAFQKFVPDFNFSFSIDALILFGVFGLLYALYETYLWRIGFLRCVGLTSFPDVSGRWVGFLTSSYQRNGQNIVVPVTLEIIQDEASVFVRACFERAQSDSLIAGFEAINGRPCLYYVYDNTISEKSRGSASQDRGVVMLEYFEKDQKRMLKGRYFNDLRPQSNYGEIQVAYSGPKLLNMGEKIEGDRI